MVAFREVEGTLSLDMEVCGLFKDAGWAIEEEEAASRARERSRRAFALRRFSSWGCVS